MEKLHFDLNTLFSLHRFGDIYAQAIREIESKTVTLELLRDAPDSIGAHWYGMRCRAVSKVSGIECYLHTGLIFLPETKVGLMVELDERNNRAVYDRVVRDINDGALFIVNRAEAEYLKLFLPDEALARLNRVDAVGQRAFLKAYMQSCAEAIIAAADGAAGFCIDEAALCGVYHLGRAFRDVIIGAKSDRYRTEINEKDPDNFGQYASGYRYWLTNRSETARLYAYFGAIYSYKKTPAGIFAEIDHFSNQRDFDRVKSHFKASPAFIYSDREEKFIKLFLPLEQAAALNGASPEEQRAILAAFFDACNTALAEASEQ